MEYLSAVQLLNQSHNKALLVAQFTEAAYPNAIFEKNYQNFFKHVTIMSI